MRAPLSEVTTAIRDLLHDNTIELREDSRFDDILGWDSMDLVSVVVEMECRFDIMFDLSEIDRLTTAGELAHLIQSKQLRAAA